MDRNTSSSQKDLLGIILKEVSRSFFLTLRVLPNGIRSQIGLAYLLARAADTMADTEVLPASERLTRLQQFQSCLLQSGGDRMELDKNEFWSGIAPFSQNDSATPGERNLLLLLPECFDLLASFSEADRDLVIQVVMELTRGMEMDLRRFPDSNELRALETFDELEEYTYYVAGCVGPFWTRVCMAHLPELQGWDPERMCELGLRFGKALQWTNVLRDIPKDLKNGRCYLPLKDLEKAGLKPDDLRSKASYSKLKPLYHQYLDHTLNHYRAAWGYSKEIPRSCFRLSLSCIWPQWIGLETIQMLRKDENPLDSARRIKVPRSRVYTMMVRSLLSFPFRSRLEEWEERLMKFAEKAE